MRILRHTQQNFLKALWYIIDCNLHTGVSLSSDTCINTQVSPTYTLIMHTQHMCVYLDTCSKQWKSLHQHLEWPNCCMLMIVPTATTTIAWGTWLPCSKHHWQRCEWYGLITQSLVYLILLKMKMCVVWHWNHTDIDMPTHGHYLVQNKDVCGAWYAYM